MYVHGFFTFPLLQILPQTAGSHEGIHGFHCLLLAGEKRWRTQIWPKLVPPTSMVNVGFHDGGEPGHENIREPC